MTRRRVVYIVIDGMNRDAFEQVTASGRAPALAFLREHGTYARGAVAVFPTITPCATASLVTGALPAEHGIPGMCWYDRDAQRFVNYGQSPRAAVVEGVSQVVTDFLVNLNTRHLMPGVETVHEQVDRLGYTSASINYMVFRGPYDHRLRQTLWHRLFVRGRLPRSLPGPREHYFADLITGPSEACSKLLSARGVQKRIRVTDGWAACTTREFVDRGETDLILFYLHENDHRSHRTGPASQPDSLAEADAHIAHVLDAFDSWEQAVAEVGFVVVADHSQSPVSDEKDHILDLADILGDFDQVPPDLGKERFEDHDLAAAGNGRVGFLYLHPDRRDQLHAPVVRALSESPGIDQVMWRDADSYVVSSERGSLRFGPADGDGVVDARGNKWFLDGDLGAVGGVLEGDELRTSEYPLALWRIRSALDCDRIGEIVVTTKLTWELRDLAGGHHRGGGDHASLHAQDSEVPFVTTLDAPPVHPTTIDVVPHIVAHFERLRRS
ncbi:MAG: alkaline phosphatase family protein [Actinomycetota bacterium]